MHDHETVALRDNPEPRSFSQTRDALLLAWCARSFGPHVLGRLQLVMPTGRSAVIGANARDEGPQADLKIKSLKAVWKIVTRGSLGFADAYIEGCVETSDLAALFRFFLENETVIARMSRGFSLARLPDRMRHISRPNSRRGSRKNIRAHYDLGNSFFAAWLDSGMTYSSAIHERGMTLEEAQDKKYAAIIDALDPVPGQKLLEIGCGWGGLAERIVQHGAHVTAITLSRAQHAYANARIERAGFKDAADIKLVDYRDVDGQFDAIASIEMIEAVGQERWQEYFDIVSARLKPGGIAVIQAITIDPTYFDDYARSVDFIQRDIFPGGMLLTEPALVRHATRAGLTFEPIQRFGRSYGWTIEEWRRRFAVAWPHLRKQGFDEHFKRKWLYYFLYCEAGFRNDVIDVGLYRFTKSPANTSKSTAGA